MGALSHAFLESPRALHPSPMEGGTQLSLEARNEVLLGTALNTKPVARPSPFSINPAGMTSAVSGDQHPSLVGTCGRG